MGALWAYRPQTSPRYSPHDPSVGTADYDVGMNAAVTPGFVHPPHFPGETPSALAPPATPAAATAAGSHPDGTLGGRPPVPALAAAVEQGHAVVVVVGGSLDAPQIPEVAMGSRQAAARGWCPKDGHVLAGEVAGRLAVTRMVTAMDLSVLGPTAPPCQ